MTPTVFMLIWTIALVSVVSAVAFMAGSRRIRELTEALEAARQTIRGDALKIDNMKGAWAKDQLEITQLWTRVEQYGKRLDKLSTFNQEVTTICLDELDKARAAARTKGSKPSHTTFLDRLHKVVDAYAE